MVLAPGSKCNLKPEGGHPKGTQEYRSRTLKRFAIIGLRSTGFLPVLKGLLQASMTVSVSWTEGISASIGFGELVFVDTLGI